MEKSHGNELNPPRSLTMDGTAVARIVESMATRPVVNMRAIRMGPRSERNPTPAAVFVVVTILPVFCNPPKQATGEQPVVVDRLFPNRFVCVEDLPPFRPLVVGPI